ncbi:Hypothetical predicted protein [Mytilus galloprovincialis]|uniref:Uncharacterized protein n=1 Tax=Mytilus galloprovincialis TaxID=29158 RepID=A0A8B6H8M3_MYTGA|nr:Hypothetical predicted protein [Mytilus galloprovincialis]
MEITENLPFTPEDVKWKVPECRRKLFSMGEFGDGEPELREQCGANQFGLCQGQSESYIQCTKCLQHYHRQCVIVEVETFACGCHIERPLKSRK